MRNRDNSTRNKITVQREDKNLQIKSFHIDQDIGFIEIIGFLNQPSVELCNNFDYKTNKNYRGIVLSENVAHEVAVSHQNACNYSSNQEASFCIENKNINLGEDKI